MEDTSIPPHSTGNGQPHQNPVNHTRPFFYVHPPSQQFYYQWQFNNPYGHYGAYPGPGVPYGRPYVAPYPYMTCPGYIMPHAPMQPIDYRRMSNPQLSPGMACEARFHQQARVHRETASSETQTEARDAVSELMVRLDRLRATEEASEENELDSGVVSQTSGLFLHSGQALSCPVEEQKEDPEALPAVEAKERGELSPLPECNASWSPGRTGELVGQQAWSVDVDGVLPLDSSSQHEESDGEQVSDESARFPAPEKQRPAPVQSDCPRVCCEENKENCSGGIHPVCRPLSPQGCNEATPERLQSNHPAKEDLGHRGEAPCPKMAGVADVQEEPVLDPQTLPYRILRLPCDEVTTGGVMQSDGPLWPVEAPALPPAGFLPSLGDGFLYSYYPSVAPERQSVLSPSLDELSSRDDMFSTDLEDVESVSGRAYVGDGKPARVAGEVSDPGEEDEGGRWEEEEECPARETRLCAACGSCLKGGSRRGKSTGTGPWACSQNDEDVAEEVEDDCDGYDDIDDGLKDPCESWEEPVRKLQGPARHMQAPGIPWQKPKNGYSSEPLGPCGLEEQERSYPRGPECCEGHRASTKPDQCKGPNVRAQSRPRTDRQLVGADRVSTGQEYWETCGKPRPKFWKAYPSRGKVRPARRRAGCKTFVPQRFRRDYNEEEEEEEEGEFVRFQRGRGSTKRRGARY